MNNAKRRVDEMSINYTLDQFNQYKVDLKELDLDDLLDEYHYRRGICEDYVARVDSIHWSRENQQRARTLWLTVQEEIRDRIENPSVVVDSADLVLL